METLQKLLDECLAYQKYGQSINPMHVKDMIKKAFNAGCEQKVKDSE